MKIPFSSLTGLTLGVISIGLVSLLVPQPSLAEPNFDNSGKVNPLQDFETRDSGSDPFSRNADAGDLFNLINRAALSNPRSLQDFSAEQNESLDAAAAEFRTRQRQRIQGKPIPVNPVSTP